MEYSPSEPELPRTAYGKVIKGKLRARYLSDKASHSPADRDKIHE